MAISKSANDSPVIVDASFDWSAGVDSSKVTTLKSDLNPNGLPRNALAWLNNATVRRAGILQRTGWQPLVRLLPAGRWQGGFIYEPDGANPYLVFSVSGHIYKATLEAPFTITELLNTIVPPWTAFGTNTINGASVENPEFNPPDAEMAFFVQGESYLVIQAGDYFTAATPTLPLFWDGTTLRRSIGLTTPAPTIAPNQNEIPAATAMDYYGNRIWYAQARLYAAGDIVGGPSGNVANHRRDSILSVTENPLAFAGDGFTVPTNAGNIRAIKHSANLNAALGQGQLYIFTRKSVFTIDVPVSRADWIATGNATSGATANMPEQKVVQLVNGSVGHRCVVPINGDVFYQAFEPSIRSLLTAVRNFGNGQWGNTPISQNEERALQFNDRSLMRFSSGIEFENRMLQAILPKVALDGVNVVHQAIAPLDFDLVSNLTVQTPTPAWEGVWDGMNILELYSGDFGGRPRAFAAMISDEDQSINVWELTTDQRFQNGDNRVTWAVEFPAFTWSSSGYEIKLKQLNGGELWIDKVAGTIDMDVYFRPDAEPCWSHWFHTEFCVARCEDVEEVLTAYPCAPFREGYKIPLVFPEPRAVCNDLHSRPNTVGYQFQLKVVIKGWCRIRGLILYAIPKMREQFLGIACPTPETKPGAMATLPNPFA